MTPNAIRIYRINAGLTQKQLAELLDVERETVARWEGGRKVDAGLVARVAERTGIPAREIRPDLYELVGGAA